MSNTYGSRELSIGTSGSDVQELQIKLSGWFGSYAANKPRWSGTFDSATEDAVERFQDYMNLPVTGIVDHWTFVRLDTFGSDYYFDIEAFKCPTRGSNGCAGFGTGRDHFYVPKKNVVVNVPGGEPPGMNIVIPWLVRGLMARGGFSAIITSGYRCALDNVAKGRTTINHMGDAVDFVPYRANWSRAVTTEVVDVGGTDVTVKYIEAVREARETFEDVAGIPDDTRASDVIYMERQYPTVAPPSSNSYYAGRWIHLDVRTALDSIGGTPVSWYVTDLYDANFPYYGNQLLSIASAEPPPPPSPPALPAEQQEAAAEFSYIGEGMAAYERWLGSQYTEIDGTKTALAGTTEAPLPYDVADSEVQGVLSEAYEVGSVGMLATLSNSADTMESFRRSAVSANHTRYDHRAFGEEDLDRFKDTLRQNQSRLRQRYEAMSELLGDCNG